MGGYLNMLNSAMPLAAQIANENYARELMQLFTTGLLLLNSMELCNWTGAAMQSRSIPSPGAGVARAFYRLDKGQRFRYGRAGEIFEQGELHGADGGTGAQHDITAKVLLNGTTLPSGQSTTQNLTGALTNIFNPGCPAVCVQTANSAPGGRAIQVRRWRVSAAFANDGTGKISRPRQIAVPAKTGAFKTSLRM
jgi:hypothetical protein